MADRPDVELLVGRCVTGKTQDGMSNELKGSIRFVTMLKS